MNRMQVLGFRILVQFLTILCGAVLGMSDNETSRKDFFELKEHCNKFFEMAEEKLEEV